MAASQGKLRSAASQVEGEGSNASEVEDQEKTTPESGSVDEDADAGDDKTETAATVSLGADVRDEAQCSCNSGRPT